MIEYFRMNIEDLWYRFALSFIQSGYGINHVCEGFILQNMFATKTPRHEV